MFQAVHHLSLLTQSGGAVPKPLLILLEGMVTITLGGVGLHIDAAKEESWIDLAPGFDKRALSLVLGSVGRLGYELMDELEGIEESEDGRIRQYLTQTWFSIEEATGEEMVKAS